MATSTATDQFVLAARYDRDNDIWMLTDETGEVVEFPNNSRYYQHLAVRMTEFLTLSGLRIVSTKFRNGRGVVVLEIV